jgi:DNA polymerase III delta prime subunit
MDAIHPHEELGEAHPRAPDRVPAPGLPLRPHQLTLLHRCRILEAGDVPASASPDTVGYYPVLSISTSLGIIGDRAGSGKSAVALALARDAGPSTPADASAAPISFELATVVSSVYGMTVAHATAGGAVETISADEARETASATVLSGRPFHMSAASGFVTMALGRLTRRVVPVTIIVVPHTTVFQWRDYLSTFAPDLRALMVTRKAHMAEVQSTMRFDALDAWPQLVVVSNTMYGDIQSRMLVAPVRVRRVIFDEADSISISGGVIDAEFTWLISASYSNLLFPRGSHVPTPRGLHYINGTRSSAIRQIMNGSQSVLRSIVVKNADAYVDASLVVPAPRQFRVLCQDTAMLRILRGIVDACTMARLDAGDVTGAIAQIAPDSNVATDDNHLVMLMMDRLNTRARNLEARLNFERGLVGENNASSIDAILRDLEAATSKVERMRERILESNTCIICCNDLRGKSIAPCCGAAYCFSCITQWTMRHNSACPMCRAPLNARDLMIVSEEVASANAQAAAQATAPQTAAPQATAPQTAAPQTAAPQATAPQATAPQTAAPQTAAPQTAAPQATAADLAGYLGAMQVSKLEMLETLVRMRRAMSPACKFLIFSNHDATFTEVKEALARAGARSTHVKGTSASIEKAILAYKRADGVDALIMDATNCGGGLNLENTTDVVLFHRFECNMEHQVVGRAQRPGRVDALNVWYLYHRDEATAAASNRRA